MNQSIDFEKSHFIKNIWNKKAQLYRRPDNWNFDLDLNEISSITLEEESISRLIKIPDNNLHNLEYTQGPFNEEELTSLSPNIPWSIMVQNLEQYLPDLNVIKDKFNFIPEDLREDIMGVICGPNGSTGPHIDQYSVFIIPISGKKTWSLESKINSVEEFNNRLIPHDDLKILRNFKSNTTFTIGLDEFLYIPPGLAHHAVSDELSLSLSYGVKTPRVQIILDVLYTKVIERIHEDERLKVSLNKDGILNFKEINEVSRLLEVLLNQNNMNIDEVIKEARLWEGY
jgi:50S ribosomal protein L16 3-hydroxylase